MLVARVQHAVAEANVLAGRYVVEERLGDGGMGVVYRARHVKFGRPFAIKVLHKSLTSNPKVVRRFEREAELAGRLRHTNVASVIDFGVSDEGMHFMAMELAPGENLAALLDEGAMSEARMLDLAKQMCSGLQHAHDHGLIHRDFKPHNVLVEQLPDGREVARIVDWGVAILREDAGDVDTDDRLTTRGIVVGTPHYMAPEQARGNAIDHRVDLFALGLICYEMLTGVMPFDGVGVEVARANLYDPIPPMRVRAPEVQVDPVLEAIVRRLLAKERADRPASGNAARELFELYEHDRASCAVLLGVALPVAEDDDLAIGGPIDIGEGPTDGRETARRDGDITADAPEPGGERAARDTEHCDGEIAARDIEHDRKLAQGNPGHDRDFAAHDGAIAAREAGNHGHRAARDTEHGGERAPHATGHDDALASNAIGHDGAPAPRDRELDRETDRLAASSSWRQIAIIAAVATCALVLLLWLGLGGGHRRARSPGALDTGRSDHHIVLEVTDAAVVETPVVLATDDAVGPSRPIVPAPPTQAPHAPAERGSGAAPTPEPPRTPVAPPSAADVALLYGAIGRELKATEAAKGMEATIELWPRYRWIRINEWLATPERRAEVARLLERLRADLRASN